MSGGWELRKDPGRVFRQKENGPTQNRNAARTCTQETGEYPRVKANIWPRTS